MEIYWFWCHRCFTISILNSNSNITFSPFIFSTIKKLYVYLLKKKTWKYYWSPEFYRWQLISHQWVNLSLKRMKVTSKWSLWPPASFHSWYIKAAKPTINVFLSSHIPIILQCIGFLKKKKKEVTGDRHKLLLLGIPWHQPLLHTPAPSTWFDKAHRQSGDKSLNLLSKTVWQASIMILSHSYNLTNFGWKSKEKLSSYSLQYFIKEEV